MTLPKGTEMVMPGDSVRLTVKLMFPIAVEQGLRRDFVAALVPATLACHLTALAPPLPPASAAAAGLQCVREERPSPRAWSPRSYRRSSPT